MKAIILLATVLLLTSSETLAQINNAITETVTVYGNGSTCKSTIEKAGSKKKLYVTEWNEETKLATITYDSRKVDLDAVLKEIALSGYDNSSYLAPDEAYKKLPGNCKYEREKKYTLHTSSGVKPAYDEVNVTDQNEQTSQLKLVFDNYFALKDALINTDGSVASAKATALLAALESVEMAKLKMEEHDVWMKVEKNLKTSARNIKESKEVEQQRDYFISLSKNMYELVKASKPAEAIFYQFCPMANGGKGATWLSKEITIKNPYYGSQMLTCGETVETIKQ